MLKDPFEKENDYIMSVLRFLLRCLDKQTNRHFYINVKCTQTLCYVQYALPYSIWGTSIPRLTAFPQQSTSAALRSYLQIWRKL